MSRQGFSAECRDCPTVRGTDYGELIRNGVMSWTTSVQAQVEVVEWAKGHAIDTGHAVMVSRYITYPVMFDHIAPEIITAVNGG